MGRTKSDKRPCKNPHSGPPERSAETKRLLQLPGIQPLYPGGPERLWPDGRLLFGIPRLQAQGYARFPSEWGEKIRAVSQDGTTVFETLSSKQSKRLVDLIWQSVHAIQLSRDTRKNASAASRIAESAFKRLEQKLARLHRALSDLSKFTKSLEPPLREPLLGFAERTLRQLESMPVRPKEYWLKLKAKI